jgi:hypothetical protein
MSVKHLPVTVAEIIGALEREAANAVSGSMGDPISDPRWRAAMELRQVPDWERRTLMLFVDTEPVSQMSAAV